MTILYNLKAISYPSQHWRIGELLNGMNLPVVLILICYLLTVWINLKTFWTGSTHMKLVRRLFA